MHENLSTKPDTYALHTTKKKKSIPVKLKCTFFGFM